MKWRYNRTARKCARLATLHAERAERHKIKYYLLLSKAVSILFGPAVTVFRRLVGELKIKMLKDDAMTPEQTSDLARLYQGFRKTILSE